MSYLRALLHDPEAKPRGYWKNTSDNAIIRSFIDYAGINITPAQEPPTLQKKLFDKEAEKVLERLERLERKERK